MAFSTLPTSIAVLVVGMGDFTRRSYNASYPFGNTGLLGFFHVTFNACAAWMACHSVFATTAT